MKKPIIEVKNLSKTFGKGDNTFNALCDISLKIYSGDYIILYGPSGCGKSTLLNCIAGLEEFKDGEVLIRGESLKKKSEDKLAEHRRKKIGMIFQQFNILKSMTVEENVALSQLFDRIDKNIRLKRAENLLKILGLGKVIKRIPTELSGGQQQKVAIARALANNPWIILADEPTGNLDSKSSDQIMDLIADLNHKSKRTIILVTHNPDYRAYANKVVYIRDGKIEKITTNNKPRRSSGGKKEYIGLEKLKNQTEKEENKSN